MDPTRGPRVALEREDLSLGRLDEVEPDLPGEGMFFHIGLHPFEDPGMLHMLKDNRYARPGSELGWVGSMRRDVPVMTHTISAETFSWDVFLRHPVLVEPQRGQNILQGRPDQDP